LPPVSLAFYRNYFEINYKIFNITLDIYKFKWYIIDVKDKDLYKGGSRMKKRIAEKSIEKQIEKRKLEVLQRLYAEPHLF
jgi:hypothetical protein